MSQMRKLLKHNDEDTLNNLPIKFKWEDTGMIPFDEAVFVGRKASMAPTGKLRFLIYKVFNFGRGKKANFLNSYVIGNHYVSVAIHFNATKNT